MKSKRPDIWSTLDERITPFTKYLVVSGEEWEQLLDSAPKALQAVYKQVGFDTFTLPDRRRVDSIEYKLYPCVKKSDI